MRRFINSICLFVTVTIVALASAAVSAKGPAVYAKKLSPAARKNLLAVSPKQEAKPAAASTKAASITILQPTEKGHIVGSGNGGGNTANAVMNWGNGSGQSRQNGPGNNPKTTSGSKPGVIQPDQRLANPKFVPQASNRGRSEPAQSARHEPNHAGAKPADVYLHNPRGGNVADNRVESKIADRSKLSKQARQKLLETSSASAGKQLTETSGTQSNRTPPVVARHPVSTAGLNPGGIRETPDQRLANPKFVPQASNRGRSEPAKK